MQEQFDYLKMSYLHKILQPARAVVGTQDVTTTSYTNWAWHSVTWDEGVISGSINSYHEASCKSCD